MPARTTLEIPKTAARLKWAATIRVGLDLEDLLGVSSNTASGILAGASAIGGLDSITKKMVEVGSIETLDIKQNRQIRKRFALGRNSLSAFQTTPQAVNYDISITKAILKKFPEAEIAFNFAPQNLVFQQFPFILELRDAGAGTAETEIKHFITGCWFVDSNVRYDVTAKDDCKLIQSAKIECANMITFDPSNGGSPVVQAATAGLAALYDLIPDEAQELISDFNLS
jgi:hypothetical protein